MSTRYHLSKYLEEEQVIFENVFEEALGRLDSLL